MFNFYYTAKRFRYTHTHTHTHTRMHLCMPSCFSCVLLFAAQWTVARQAPLSMGFSRQEYWSGFPCPPPEDLPDPGIKLVSLLSPALAGWFFTISITWETPPLTIQREKREGKDSAYKQVAAFLEPIDKQERQTHRWVNCITVLLAMR